jgi:hypothetical protein
VGATHGYAGSSDRGHIPTSENEEDSRGQLSYNDEPSDGKVPLRKKPAHTDKNSNHNFKRGKFQHGAQSASVIFIRNLMNTAKSSFCSMVESQDTKNQGKELGEGSWGSHSDR